MLRQPTKNGDVPTFRITRKRDNYNAYALRSKGSSNWLPEPKERTVSIEAATRQKLQSSLDEHTDQQGRSRGNKYPDSILLLPSDLLPVLPHGQTQPEARVQGHC